MGGARFVSQDGDASFSKMTLQRGAGITQLTFDCYGTLIDWEQGILSAVNRLFVRGRARPTSEAILRSFVTHEARIESGEWRPYRDVLQAVLRGMAVDFGLAIPESETNLLSDSLPQWPPFPDTVDALRRLAKKFRLVILSNVDDALFAQTQNHLGVRFDEVITAEQVKSYKPGKAHFEEALRRLRVPVSQVLHVAQSLYHDHVPAQRLGFQTAWINRPSLLAGTGLAPLADIKPAFVFPDLRELAASLA
jgi:2-haloacid dehalogenase